LATQLLERVFVDRGILLILLVLDSVGIEFPGHARLQRFQLSVGQAKGSERLVRVIVAVVNFRRASGLLFTVINTLGALRGSFL